MDKEKKSQIMTQYARHEGDTGSRRCRSPC